MKTKNELALEHMRLHRELDKLIACYIDNTDKSLTDTNLMEFMEWSFKQTTNPSCFKGKNE